MIELSSASTTLQDELATVSDELVLLVMEQNSLLRYPLPASGTLRIGRSDSADVPLRDARASRLHAVLHLGASPTIEDTGSRNGTWLRRERLPAKARVTLAPGDAVQICSATLVLRRLRRSDSQSGEQRSVGAAAEPIVREPAMRELYRMIERVAAGTISVLISGETGVGKELVATAIHRRSPRRNGPFVRVNCATLPGPLFESELFGHERGAFTGALKTKPGLLELASGGTAFLDEIGELPYEVQAKLLRAIEAREIVRLGGLRVQPLDVRFVCATNRDLAELVEQGRFREDLYFRLSAARLVVPPLRERPAELEGLVEQLLNELGRQLGMSTAPVVSSAAMSRLREHAWPGNVRELKNVLELAALLATDGVITPDALAAGLISGEDRMAAPESPAASRATSGEVGDADDGERQRIVRALAVCSGNQTRAAAELRMPRRTLVAKLARYAIPRPRDRK